MSAFCVIGANGFLGRHLCRALANRAGAEVRAVGRDLGEAFSADLRGRVEAHTADLRDTAAVAAIARDCDFVFDLVSEDTPRTFDRFETERLIEAIRPHCRLYEALAHHGPRVVFISSGGTVYGDTEANAIPEDHAARPTSGYGLGKLMTEQALRLIARSAPLTYTVLRLSNPYGPGQIVKNGQGIIPALLGALQEKRPFTVFGDGSTVRDYIYIDDVMAALARVIDRGSASRNETFNIGSGSGLAVSELIALFEELHPDRLSVRFAAADAASVRRNVLDIAKARRVLQWEPAVPIREGLRRLIADHRERARPA